MMVRYETGDLVYPTDLPRRLLCRIVDLEDIRIRGNQHQILKLHPVEGQPWHLGTSLVRWDEGVRLARLGDLWRNGTISREERAAVRQSRS